MKLESPSRKLAAMAWAAAALMLCALPSFAQDEDSEAASAQQGGHYEARTDDGQTETEEAPAPIPQPAARKRTAPRIFRARPGGIHAEPNQEAASPGVEEGVILGGGGVTQGTADKQVGQGSDSSSGGGGGGFSDGPLGSSPAPQTGGRSRCDTTSMNIQGAIERYTMNRGQSRSIEVRTPALVGSHGAFTAAPDPVGGNVNKYMSVSTTPCKFDYAAMDAGSSCEVSHQDPQVTYVVQAVGAPAVAGKCSLLPNTLYYINMRNEFAYTLTRNGNKRGIDTCGQGAICGGILQLRGYTPNGGTNPPQPPVNPGGGARSPRCVPPPAMTAAEKKQWFCSQPAHISLYGAACPGYANPSYISDYAKYPGLNAQGCPMHNSSLPCGGFSPCNQ